MVPDRAVPAGQRTGDDAARRRQFGQLARAEVETVHRCPRCVGVHHQQRTAVGVEVGVQVAGQIDLQFGRRARPQVPDQQLVPPAPLVPDQQPLVSGHRGEAQGVQAPARGVGQLGQDGAVRHGYRAQGRVAGVAVLGVRQHPDALVDGQPTDPGVLGVAIHQQRRGSVPRQVHPGAVVIGESRQHHPGADLEAGRITRINAGEGRPRDAGRSGTEGLHPPGAELVTIRVVEPPQLFAVGGQHGVHGAVRAVGRDGVRAGRDVPAGDLVPAGGVGHVGRPVGGVPGHHRQAEPDGREPPPPALFGGGVIEQGCRYPRGGMRDLSGRGHGSGTWPSCLPIGPSVTVASPWPARCWPDAAGGRCRQSGRGATHRPARRRRWPGFPRRRGPRRPARRGSAHGC